MYSPSRYEENIGNCIATLNSQAARLEACFRDSTGKLRMQELDSISRGIILTGAVLQEAIDRLRQESQDAQVKRSGPDDV
jgi:hypothetical protein